jgi:hypothetical protein
MNQRPIEWIKKDDTWITSLIFWNKEYIPYQGVILRKNGKHQVQLVYYFKLLNQFVGRMMVISQGRTSQEEEWLFHIARIGKDLLEQWLNAQAMDGQPSPPVSVELEHMIEEAFISALGMQLIEEDHHPDFGFYALSPNFNKIQKMIEGKSYHVIEFLQKLKLKG